MKSVKTKKGICQFGESPINLKKNGIIANTNLCHQYQNFKNKCK